MKFFEIFGICGKLYTIELFFPQGVDIFVKSNPNMSDILLTDKLSRRHIRFCLSDNNQWEKYESKDRVEWTLVKTDVTLNEIVKEKEQVKNRNYLNLFRKIFGR